MLRSRLLGRLPQLGGRLVHVTTVQSRRSDRRRRRAAPGPQAGRGLKLFVSDARLPAFGLPVHDLAEHGHCDFQLCGECLFPMPRPCERWPVRLRLDLESVAAALGFAVHAEHVVESHSVV